MLSTRAIVLLLSLSLAPACNPDVVPPPPRRAAGASDLSSVPSVGEAYCYVAFSPDEALRYDTEMAAARWSLATGCEVVVAEGGIPIVLAPSIRRPDGSESPGVTSAERDLIEINAQARPEQRASSVLHEMGHALGGDHTESDGVLSGEKGRRDIIDAAALVTVCSRLSCGVLSPE